MPEESATRQTSAESFKALAKVWPLATKVMRELKKKSETMPHLTAAFNRGMLRGMASEQTF